MHASERLFSFIGVLPTKKLYKLNTMYISYFNTSQNFEDV